MKHLYYLWGNGGADDLLLGGPMSLAEAIARSSQEAATFPAGGSLFLVCASRQPRCEASGRVRDSEVSPTSRRLAQPPAM